jgi:hypothetical protein
MLSSLLSLDGSRARAKAKSPLSKDFIRLKVFVGNLQTKITRPFFEYPEHVRKEGARSGKRWQ